MGEGSNLQWPFYSTALSLSERSVLALTTEVSSATAVEHFLKWTYSRTWNQSRHLAGSYNIRRRCADAGSCSVAFQPQNFVCRRWQNEPQNSLFSVERTLCCQRYWFLGSWLIRQQKADGFNVSQVWWTRRASTQINWTEKTPNKKCWFAETNNYVM